MIAESWGRFPRSNLCPKQIFWTNDPLPLPENGLSILPYGMGRSYGDSCLNLGHSLVSTRGLDRFIFFDQEIGLLRVEAGVTLDEIIRIVVPKGWFLPVVPGTKFVTVGGAIANDIHGKNHHRAGSFGHHVLSFSLLRSDGTKIECTPDKNLDWFCATVGGLGLTGLVTEALIQLKRIRNPWLDVETVKFKNLDQLLSMIVETDEKFEYSVAWIDSLKFGEHLGRGHLIRANHNSIKNQEFISEGVKLNVPFDLPKHVLNPLSVKVFNNLYYSKQVAEIKNHLLSIDPFFFPLDGIHSWNRLYGKSGFLQYQCLVPPGEVDAIKKVLGKVAKSKKASFLSVLKMFGSKPSLGMLSFPMPGLTLTLDFAYQGAPTLKLLEELDEIVHASGGRIYPAKDARLSNKNFQRSYPNWNDFKKFIDPKFSSSFWRRVSNENI